MLIHLTNRFFPDQQDMAGRCSRVSSEVCLVFVQEGEGGTDQPGTRCY